MNWSEKLIELEAKTRIPDGSPFAMNELGMFLCNRAKEIAALVEAGNAVIAWCDKNPPAGDALWCVQQLRQSLAALEDEK